MSPLYTGPNSIRKNVSELMGTIQSASRKKAITTLAKRKNMTFEQAKFYQAKKIAEVQARKK